MICIQKAHIPRRKTKYFEQWKSYIDSVLKESRGYNKHEKNESKRN